MRFPIYKPHMFLSCLLILTLSYGVTASTDKEKQFKDLQKQMQKIRRKRNFDKIHAFFPKMRDAYEKIYNDSQIGKKVKLSAGLVIVKTFIDDGEWKKAIELCNKLSLLPALTATDKVKIQCAVGDAFKSRGYHEKAVKEYEKALTLPGIKDADKQFVYNNIATLYQRNNRNPDKLKNVIAKMIEVNEKSKSLKRWLTILSKFKFPDNSYMPPEVSEFAWSNLLKQDKLKPKEKADSYSGLIEARLRLGKIKDAKQVAEKATADKDISAETRLMARYSLLGLDAIEQSNSVSADVIKQSKNELNATAMDQYNALNTAGAALRELKEGEVARQFSKMAEKLVAKPQKTYTCRYMEKAPLGASGWLASDLINNADLRETRFSNYKEKDAAALITDVNAERSTSAKGTNKAYYFKNTAFYMVYDQNGWHIFVLCKEPKIKQMLLDGVSPGALEMYFAPGSDRAYYQWIVSQKNGKTDTYDWNSPNRSFRLAKDHMKSETVVSGDNIGTYIFFPWEMVYDKLPFNNGKEWIFEMIRWSPGGGISWSGGTVHNTGKWGEVKWQAPTSEQLLQIKKNLLRKAWGKYKQTRKKLVNDFWAKHNFGDQDFLKTTLAPEVERLNKLGEKMVEPDKLTEAEINSLFKNAISDWMEFDFKVAELRKSYLTKRLTDATREAAK